MQRQYSEQNIRDIADLEQEMDAAGYDYKTVEGANQNGTVLADYYEAHPEIPLTKETLRAFVNKNQHLFVVRTSMQRKYDAVVKTSGRTQAELDAFLSLLSSVGARYGVDTAGENLWSNAAVALEWMRGRPIDTQNLTLAIQNLAPRSQGGKYTPRETLIFTAQQQVASDPRKGLHSADENYKPGRLFSKDEVNQTDINRFRGHTEEQTTPTPQETKEQNAWAQINANIVADGRSHAQREQLQTVLDKALAANGNSHRLANAELEKQYRAMYRRASTPVTPLEEVIRGARK